MIQRKTLCAKESCSKIDACGSRCKSAGHFGFLKTLSRLKHYHWKHKSRDVKNYVHGCLVCQQKRTIQGRS